MILETTRILADWLGRQNLERVGGFNDKLLSLPLDVGDKRPRTITEISDITRDEQVATRRDPYSLPAIYVIPDGDFEMEGEVSTNNREASEVPVAIRYLTDDYESYQAWQATMYSLRAIVKSLKVLAEDTNQGDRTRNNVCILSFNSIDQLLVTETVGNSRVTGAVVVSCYVRDASP